MGCTQQERRVFQSNYGISSSFMPYSKGLAGKILKTRSISVILSITLFSIPKYLVIILV